jgi:K+/H+ antiporter YhaU regulatory subunit KhtT
MVDVRRVKLPGVGVLHTFITDDGGKCGVITHRSGHSDLITFSDEADGADVTKVSLRLSEDEAHTLAELLGGTRITESRSTRSRASASTGSRSTTTITSPGSPWATWVRAAWSG